MNICKKNRRVIRHKIRSRIRGGGRLYRGFTVIEYTEQSEFTASSIKVATLSSVEVQSIGKKTCRKLQTDILLKKTS